MTTKPRPALLAAIGLPLIALLIWTIAQLGWLGFGLGVAILAGGFFAVWRISQGFALGVAGAPESSPLQAGGLPTGEEAVYFELVAIVHWRARTPDPSHEAQARQSILRRAGTITSTWKPAQYSMAEHDVGSQLSVPEVAGADELAVWATDVRIALPEDDQRQVAKLAELRRDKELWDLGAENERRICDYLRDDALRTPKDAVVWWLARNDGAVEKTVELADVLTTLSELATGRRGSTELPDVQRLVVALSQLDPAAQRSAADRLAAALEEIGLLAEADVVRQEFGVRSLDHVVVPIAVDGRALADSRDQHGGDSARPPLGAASEG